MAILPVLHHCIFSLSSSVGWCALFYMYVCTSLLCNSFLLQWCAQWCNKTHTKLYLHARRGWLHFSRHAGVYVMRCIYFSIALCALFVWKCYCWFVRCLCATSDPLDPLCSARTACLLFKCASCAPFNAFCPYPLFLLILNPMRPFVCCSFNKLPLYPWLHRVRLL